MEAQLHMVQHYLRTNRPDLAIPMARDLLAQDPTNTTILASYCAALYMADRDQECFDTTVQILDLDPGNLEAHYYRCLSAIVLRRMKDAQESMELHLEAAPEDPDSWFLKAGYWSRKQVPQRALVAAEEGLSIDPIHNGLIHLRTESLMALGRVDESVEQLKLVQGENPEEPLFHVSRGWAALRKGDRRQARTHFREGLRLDPNSEGGRQGMLECLRSFNPLYRGLLKFMFAMSKFSPGTRIGIILAAWFGAKVLRGIVSSAGYPMAGNVIVLLYAMLALMTFLLEPLTDLVLLASRDGRLVLKPEEKRKASLLGSLLVLGATLFTVSATTQSDAGGVQVILGISAILIYIPLGAALSKKSAPKRRALLGLLCLGIAGCWLGAMGFTLLGGEEGLETASQLALISVLLAAVSTWLCW